MKKDLLIVGIDPGTTAAYAVLDIRGNVLRLNSAKGLSLSSMISEVIKLGKPLIVGSDVSPAPAFVEDFAVKTGSKLIDPEQDLSSEEKRLLTKEIETKNIHESDALASALYAFRTINPLLEKADRILEEEDRLERSDEVKEIVIKHDIAIRTALEMLEKPEEEAKVIQKVIEKKVLLEKDFINLYEKLKSAHRDMQFLRLQNQRLSKEAELAKRKFEFMLVKLGKYVPRKKLDEATYFKDKRIIALQRELEHGNTELKDAKEEIAGLKRFIANLGDKVILKKLGNLGYPGFESASKLLRIQKDDLLLVDNLDIYSQKAINILKDIAPLVIFRQASKKTRKSMPFTTVSAENLDIVETEFFAAVDRKSLEREKGKVDILGKIVEEYREKRN